MNTNEITAVMFDWDLTLAHILGEVTAAEKTAAVFQRGGINCTPREMQVAMDRYERDMHLGSVRCFKKPQTRRDITYYYKQLLIRLGYSNLSRDFLNRLYSAYAYLPTFLYDDVLPLLDSLQQKGYQLGIISNHAISARPTMEKFVGNYIPPHHMIISQEIDVHKPAKTIFRRAASRLRVDPSACMLVGDNLCVDAIGAVQQGQFGKGLWLDRKGEGVDKPLPKDVARITSLQQVYDYLT